MINPYDRSAILKESHLSTLAETEEEAKALASFLKPGDLLLLEGELGVGKTAFSRALIRVLSADDTLLVPSPTFNLVQVYETPRGKVWHVDLYRLTAEDNLQELGLNEAFADAICLVEWPNRLGSFWHLKGLQIHFSMNTETGQRHLVFRGTEEWKKRGIGSVKDKSHQAS